MSRFGGIPVEEESPKASSRFGGIPIEEDSSPPEDKYSTPLTRATKPIEIGAQGIASGVAGFVPDTLRFLESFYDPNAKRGPQAPISRAAANLPPEDVTREMTPPQGPSITNAVNDLLARKTGSIAETPVEKGIQTGAQIFGGGLMGGPGSKASLLSNITAGVGGGIGSQTENPYGTALGTLFGAFVPSGIEGLMYGAKRGLGWLGGMNNPETRASINTIEQSGLVPDASTVGNGFIQNLTGKLGESATDAARTQALATAENQARDFGYAPQITEEGTGNRIRAALEKTKTNALPIKQAVSEAAKDIKINLPEEFSKGISEELGLSGTNQPLLQDFMNDINKLAEKNTSSAMPSYIQRGGEPLTPAQSAILASAKNPQEAAGIAKSLGLMEEGVPESFLSFDNIQDLKKKYGYRTDAINPSVKATSGKIYELLHNAEMNAANDVNESVNLAKFNKIYSNAKDFERDIVGDKLSSQITSALQKMVDKNPETYTQYMSAISPEAQNHLRASMLKQLGGGEKFDIEEFGKNINSLGDDSLDALAGGKGLGKDYRTLANSIEEYSKSTDNDNGNLAIKLIKGALGLGEKYGVGVFNTIASPFGLSLDKMLANPENVKIMSGMSSIGKNVSNPSVGAIGAGAINQPEQEEKPTWKIEPLAARIPARTQITITPVDQSIKDAEKFRPNSYFDSNGHRTVGYGFNMDTKNAKDVWKQAQIPESMDEVRAGRQAISNESGNRLLSVSHSIAENDAKKIYSNYNKLPAGPQLALRHLAYVFGGPALKSNLPRFNAEINKGDIPKAIHFLEHSTWGKKDPKRSKMIIDFLKQGVAPSKNPLQKEGP